MKTANFFNMFKNHTLGKKRSHGSYRVIDGDSCQVLVRASTRYGVPNGSELIAITFSPLITLWHGPNLQRIRHSVVADMLRLNSIILNEDADNLLDSGIIDIDDINNKMLIEIGDTPWLFENEAALVDDRWSWKYNTGTKLGVRCASIADALIDAKMQPNTISTLGWVMERMPADFKPDGITPEDRITLSKPITPMNYGFEIEHCERKTSYIRKPVRPLGPDSLFLKSAHADSTNGMAYMTACKVWNDALARYAAVRPDRYENISCHGGEMVLVGGSTGQLYLKGEHIQMYDSSRIINLAGWHKLLNKSSKIRLKE